MKMSGYVSASLKIGTSQETKTKRPKFSQAKEY